MIRKEISEYQVRDEAYIEAYCDDPQSGKSAALEKAGQKLLLVFKHQNLCLMLFIND